MSSASTRKSSERVGDLAAGDELREPLDDGRLAHTRLPDQHRVVLLAAAQDLDHALDLRGPADGRIELALAGELGEVPAEVVERGRLRLLLALLARLLGLPAADRRGLGGTHVRAEHLERLGPGLLERHPERVQHLGRDPLLLA